MLSYGTKIKMKSTSPFPDLEGFIAGVATRDQPVIGASYIIEPATYDSKNPNLLDYDKYCYTHFTAFQCQFDVI